MRTSRLVLQFFLTTCWTLANAIYRAIQRVVWSFNGTASELRARERPDQYGNSAQVMRILFRFKFDEYLTPANVNDFILLHERFDSPEYVLQDHITLYQVSKTEAIFIEARPGTELWRARDHTPFLMPSQFKFGRKVVRMPISSFWRLADSLGDPKGQVVFLANTTRCGSTLLTQMFEVTNKIVAISEPSALTVLAMMASKEKMNSDLKRLVVATVRVLCKPTSNRELAYVLKLKALDMQGLPQFAEAFPKARHLFMYRDSLKVAQSLYRLSEELPVLRTLYVAGKGSESRLGYCAEAMGMPKDAFTFPLNSDLSVGTIFWGATVRMYQHFRDSGLVDIAAVRYEDIVGRPVEAMTTILRYINLPDSLASMAKSALEWDSQRNTPLAISVLRRHRTVEYSGLDKAECDLICDTMGVPHLGQPYIAPGTITAN